MSILIVGDSILDEFRDGTISRVSPESSVLVLDNPSSSLRLGGALNTFHNVTTLGQKAEFRSLLGKDQAGQAVLANFHDVFGPDSFFVDNAYKTPHKIRYLSSGHQLLRVDHEDKDLTLPDHSREHPIYSWAIDLKVVESPRSVLVLSDYEKGSLPPHVCRVLTSKFKGCTVLVDSKKRDLSIFSGATLLTPNLSEGRLASNETSPKRIVEALHEITGSSVLLTLGAQGMLFYSKELGMHSIDAVVREISDVTGAGDSVISAVAVAVSEGASLLEAVRWSALVAGEAVSHVGTHAVSRDAIPSWR